MGLRAIQCPDPGRVTPTKLRAELQAASVPLEPAGLLEPLNCYYSGAAFVVVVAFVGSEWDEAVRQVVAAHVPDPAETPKQRRKREVREVLASRDETIVLLTSANRELFESLREARATINQMRQQLIQAGLPLTVQPLINRTWEQATAAALGRADATIDSEVMP